MNRAADAAERRAPAADAVEPPTRRPAVAAGADRRTPWPRRRRRSSSSRRRAGAAGSPTGTTVLDAARSLGVDLDSVCGGRGICGRCQVEQSVGEFAKHGIDVRAGPPLGRSARSRPTYRERARAWPPTGGCRARPSVCGDVVVDVPPESQVHRQVVRKGLDVRDVHRRPGRPAPLRRGRRRPSSRRRPATSRRLFEALEREWELTDLERRPPRSSARSSRRSRRASTAVTVAVHDGARGHRASGRASTTRRYGVAIDVGSTTIAGHLADLADGAVLASDGVMNPQIRFGEDLMSRVSYAMMHERRRRDDGGRPQGARRARRRARDRAPAIERDRDPRARARRQPDHAPPRCSASTRRRSARAPFALATDRRGRARPRRSSSCAPIPAPASTSCRASPATSAPTRPA